MLRNALREHVNALAVDIGPRPPFNRDSLVRAANYIYSVFEEAGLSVREQDYQYYDQRVTNVLATAPKAAGGSAYYLVGAHYDCPGHPGCRRQCECRGGAIRIGRTPPEGALKAPVLFAAFTLEEPPAHLTGHQGSRIFVRSCQSNANRMLGAIILEMVGYTAPRPHFP